MSFLPLVFSALTAKELGIKQLGSFQCLTGKVDLSTHEAEHTLQEWKEQLAKLREELSVRQIAKEISAARVPYTVKVLAYHNGDGRMKPGELIVGSSVPGVSVAAVIGSFEHIEKQWAKFQNYLLV